MLKQGGGRIVFAGSISAFTSSLNRAFPKPDPPCGIIRTDMLSKVEAIHDVRIANGLLDYCAGQILHADGGFHLRTL